MDYGSKVAVADIWCGPKAHRDLILDLAGPFRLRDAQGADLTPRSRKAQGLLALLGTSPGLRRSRAWLQDKLWSDRGAEQGAASLRQCLTEIRAILRDHLDCLRAESGWIALDPGRVEVNSALPDQDTGDVEFLEGLDIRDPEFEHWLRDQRMLHSQRANRFQLAEPPHGLGKRHDFSRSLIRVEKDQGGYFGEDVRAADLIRAYEAQIAALERLVGKQALELELLKGAMRDGPPPENGPRSVIPGLSAAEGSQRGALGPSSSPSHEWAPRGGQSRAGRPG